MLALSGLIAGGMLSGCSSREEKVENAAENVNRAQKDLEEAERRYAEEWEKFRTESEQQVSSNESTILLYREREKTDKTFKQKYKETLDRLEAKNAELKVKMNEAKDKTRDNWEEFKREWNHDMDELGTALRDLGRDNAK